MTPLQKSIVGVVHHVYSAWEQQNTHMRASGFRARPEPTLTAASIADQVHSSTEETYWRQRARKLHYSRVYTALQQLVKWNILERSMCFDPASQRDAKCYSPGPQMRNVIA
jgi:hypothetical protein